MRKNFPERINQRRQKALDNINKRLKNLPVKSTNNEKITLEGDDLINYKNYLENQALIIKNKLSEGTNNA